MKILVIDPATTTVAELRYFLETADLDQYKFLIGSLKEVESELLFDLLLEADEEGITHFTDDRPLAWTPRLGFEFESTLRLNKVPAEQLLTFMEAHLGPFERALRQTAKQALAEFPDWIPAPTPRQPERFKGYQSTRRKYK